MNLSLVPNPKAILVVDDNGISRLLPGLILRPFGWEVYEVDGGTAALDKLKTVQVSCVLLDISMSEVGGRDVLKDLRGNEQLRDLKIVAYTAYAQQCDISSFLSEGFDAILIKPLTSLKLLDALRSI
jgi:two-component system, sensor histidine kinase ChiS